MAYSEKLTIAMEFNLVYLKFLYLNSYFFCLETQEFSSIASSETLSKTSSKTSSDTSSQVSSKTRGYLGYGRLPEEDPDDALGVWNRTRLLFFLCIGAVWFISVADDVGICSRSFWGAVSRVDSEVLGIWSRRPFGAASTDCEGMGGICSRRRLKAGFDASFSDPVTSVVLLSCSSATKGLDWRGRSLPISETARKYSADEVGIWSRRPLVAILPIPVALKPDSRVSCEGACGCAAAEWLSFCEGWFDMEDGGEVGVSGE